MSAAYRTVPSRLQYIHSGYPRTADLCELLESALYEVLEVLYGAGCVHPGEPLPQVLPIALSQVRELLGVTLLQEPHFRVPCELVAEHPVCPLATHFILHHTPFTEVHGMDYAPSP